MTQRKIALSIEEAADYTGIGRNTLRKLVEWKKLPVLKVGRKVLIKTDMLELFILPERAAHAARRHRRQRAGHCGGRRPV